MSDPVALRADALREDALAIWQAGVKAVRSERLVRNHLRREGEQLCFGDEPLPLTSGGRILVVGAGKAGGGMAAAVEEILGPDWLETRVTGWVNVPADCVRPLRKIHLHPARPAGVNEPTAAGVAGAEEILRLVRSARAEDLVLVLISGGGSALLPCPVPEISLEDKLAVTRFLMSAGATIHELNTVRTQLSRIKGGGLARALTAGRMRTMIISDVIGDPLDIIASGATVPETTSPEAAATAALTILRKFGGTAPQIPQAVLDYLTRAAAGGAISAVSTAPQDVVNRVIGNNAVALAAAAVEAERRGFKVHSFGSDNAGEADAVGRELAEWCRLIRHEGRPVKPPACILSGGEPVVHLVPTDQPRKGGRNQQVAVAALERLWSSGPERICIVSGGTDGEDGPTDAAGGIADSAVAAEAAAAGLDPLSFLTVQNAYPFLSRCGGLLQTGPTHTNVMDLRVALIAASEP